MVVNKRASGRSKPMVLGLALGCAASLVLTLLGAALIANLILSGKMPTESVGYGAIVVLLLASIIGAWLSSSLIKRRRMVVCLIAGVCYYIALLAITAVFFGGQYQGMGVTALLILGGSGAVAFLGLRGERSPGKKVKFRHFR